MQYEIMVIFSPDLGEKKLEEELKELRSMLTAGKGKILDEDIHGIRPFAYRIKKYDEGYYVVFHFEMATEKIHEIEHTLNIHQPVIRYLITKIPKHYQFKTLAEYDARVETEKRKVEEERKTQDEKRRNPGRPPMRKPAEKVEKAEKIEKKPPSKEVDAKLKSIIDDPDITL